MLFRRAWPMHQHPRRHCQRHPVLPIYAMLFAMQCARSMYIVLVSWFALQITGEIASVGKVLICWQLLAFTAGPFIGPLIDRAHRRTVFVMGETIHGSGVGLLALIAWAYSPEHTPISVLYATACLISIGSLLSYPSSQALIQLAGARLLMRTVSIGIFSSQVGNIVGAAIGGLCLVFLSVTGALTVCAASSFVAAAFASFVSDEDRICSGHSAPHMQDLVAGLLETVRNPRLKVAACALLLAYASAHASNALLAGFARYELKLPSNLYGWLAAMYSGGGLIGSVTFAGLAGVASERLLIGVGAVLLACATAAFSTSQTMAQAMLWQGLIGLSFMMVRAGSDVTILKTASGRMVGRVRSNIDAGIGLVAILIYLLPSLIPKVSARDIFLGLACLFACGSCVVLWMQRSGQKAEHAQRRDGRVDPDRHPLAQPFEGGMEFMNSRSECRTAAFSNSPQLDEISLRPVSLSDRPAIKQLELDPEQEPFAGPVDAIFDELQNSRYPDLEHPFAIVVGKEKVGFFVLREKQALPDWAPRGVVTLHSFRICRACQGKGYGRAGANLAMSWVQRERPGVRQLMLAVNTRNVLAKSVYLKSGFVDTGTIFRGPIGDQHILAAAIPASRGR